MTKRNILLQLDSDPQPSVFDAVVAVDAGVDVLLRHGGVTPETVQPLVHGTMFTRGGDDLKHTAIFLGGSDVAAAERVLAAVEKSFFGPVRVSVLFDPNGANTTAAAAVLAAAKHVPLAGATATVLGATGPVGSRAVRLLLQQGATVRVGSRDLARAAKTCDSLRAQFPGAQLSPHATATPEQTRASVGDATILIAAGAAGVQLLTTAARQSSPALRVAIDLNAVPPVGLEGIKPTDRAANREGQLAYGALGIGGAKMKIHKAALQQLFTANNHILNAEQIFTLGAGLGLFGDVAR